MTDEQWEKRLEKNFKLGILYFKVLGTHFNTLIEYFDLSSEKNLDKKIAVFEELIANPEKSIEEIDGYLEILEKHPGFSRTLEDGTKIIIDW